MRLSFFLIILLFVSSVWAGIGSVTELSGTAIIKRGKDTIAVSKGTPVEMNDKVETKNGKVKITFKDSTTVNVTESSSLIIDDFVYDAKSNNGKLNIKTASGTVRYASGNIAHTNPNSVNIKTPTATIAVRGTDFVMSVNETGASMVILMPACDIEYNINLKGSVCNSGAIDVETSAGSIAMNKPYEATLVESASQLPSPPIIVNLNGSAINNNLMIAQPKTINGLNIVQAARNAAEKTGILKTDDSSDLEKFQVIAGQNAANSANTNSTTVIIDIDDASNAGARFATGNPYLFELYNDTSKAKQVGWEWEELSPNNKTYANIILPMSTKIQLIVSQDMIVNAYNFGPGGRAQGVISVVQQYR